MPGSPVQDVGLLLLLFGALLPTGALLLRGAERFLGHRLAVSGVERLLLGFYAAGGLLFVLATVPVPWYGLPLLLVAIVGGGALYILVEAREGGHRFRSFLAEMRAPERLVLGLATVGLLFFETFPASGHPFPDSYDGGASSLWVKLVVTQHTLPWTLAPFANAGVVYPQGSTVWMTVPTLLFGWSIPDAVVLLPALFLSLSAPAAYCWGSRLGKAAFGTTRPMGLLFAGWFSLVASWPRLIVGGLYDFAFALPLLVLFIGWISTLPRGKLLGWRETILLGAGAGMLASLSLVAGEILVVLLVAFLLVHRSWVSGSARGWLSRIVLVLAIQFAFLARSLAGTVIWFSYPSHVLAQSGNPPFATVLPNGPLGLGLVQEELNPFVPWKWKLSPFPTLSLLLQVLLAVGLIFLAIALARKGLNSVAGLPRNLLGNLGRTTGTLFVATALLLLTATENPVAGTIRSATNLGEFSVALFIAFSAVALLPLIAATLYIEKWWAHLPSPNASSGRRIGPALERGHDPPLRRPWAMRSFWIVSMVVLLLPMAAGALVTGTEAPGWIDQQFLQTGNVSSYDVDALAWAGEHLPSCSGVFVAPGSAGLFLPLYGEQKLIYQMNPRPVNQSFFLAVQDLTEGSYTNHTRTDLVLLGATAVFATGATYASDRPIVVGPLLASPDFRLLFSEGDAVILEFIPGVNATGCGP